MESYTFGSNGYVHSEKKKSVKFLRTLVWCVLISAGMWALFLWLLCYVNG
jgi:hypothetical protein